MKPVFSGHEAEFHMTAALSLATTQSSFVFYRASPTCLTECSSLTQHRSKCTMPVLRRLSKVCIDIRFHTPFPFSKSMRRGEIEYIWV